MRGIRLATMKKEEMFGSENTVTLRAAPFATTKSSISSHILVLPTFKFGVVGQCVYHHPGYTIQRN